MPATNVARLHSTMAKSLSTNLLFSAAAHPVFVIVITQILAYWYVQWAYKHSIPRPANWLSSLCGNFNCTLSDHSQLVRAGDDSEHRYYLSSIQNYSTTATDCPYVIPICMELHTKPCFQLTATRAHTKETEAAEKKLDGN